MAPTVAPVRAVKYAAQLTPPHSTDGTVPAGMFAQSPSLPATLHARQVPPLALVRPYEVPRKSLELLRQSL